MLIWLLGYSIQPVFYMYLNKLLMCTRPSKWSHVLKRKPCPCQYVTIIFALVFVPAAAVCHHIMSLVTVSRPCRLSNF